jgi:hypothetical protein
MSPSRQAKDEGDFSLRTLQPAHGPFQAQKCSQQLIRTHNEAPWIVAMRVSNPDRAASRIHS